MWCCSKSNQAGEWWEGDCGRKKKYGRNILRGEKKDFGRTINSRRKKISWKEYCGKKKYLKNGKSSEREA